jgi:glutaredoxin
LTQKREDGTYSCRPVSRFKFERDLLREPGNVSKVLPPECKELTDSPKDRVILYSAVWCGVCKATAEFLRKEGIPYEEKDVEKDAGAQQELACKALKTGKKINGVPVLDIGGTLLLGFDRDDILKLSKNLEKAKNQDQKQP